MNQDLRREIINQSLGIKPINHGQVYTFQIAIPDARTPDLELERKQAIARSLLAHQSNLISLIIRRTTAYDDEDIEYEVVYGADWLQVAQELDIERVWAWVFDLTDEQVEATIAEMQALTQSDATPPALSVDSERPAIAPGNEMAKLIDQKLQAAVDVLKNAVTSPLNDIRKELDEKLKVLNYRIDTLSASGAGAATLEQVLAKLDQLQQQTSVSRPSRRVVPPENPVDLLTASDQEIEVALDSVGTHAPQIHAAIAAIHHWKNSEQGLSWQNLARSAKAKTNTPHKIKGFAEGTYDQLRAIATIPDATVASA